MLPPIRFQASDRPMPTPAPPASTPTATDSAAPTIVASILDVLSAVTVTPVWLCNSDPVTKALALPSIVLRAAAPAPATETLSPPPMDAATAADAAVAWMIALSWPRRSIAPTPVVTLLPAIEASTSLSMSFSAMDTPMATEMDASPDSATATDTATAVAVIWDSSVACTVTVLAAMSPLSCRANTLPSIVFSINTPEPARPMPVPPEPAIATDTAVFVAVIV